MTDNKRHFQVFDYNLLINKLLIYLIDLSTRLHDMIEVVGFIIQFFTAIMSIE